jgi:hypothetical protein
MKKYCMYAVPVAAIMPQKPRQKNSFFECCGLQ